MGNGWPVDNAFEFTNYVGEYRIGVERRFENCGKFIIW